jgi:hypothetical protein
MKRRPKYQIARPGPGLLTYREGYKEYTFPIFEEEGETVFVVWPTRQRLFLFFLRGGWTWVPKVFSKSDYRRVMPRVLAPPPAPVQRALLWAETNSLETTSHTGATPQSRR